MIKCRTINHCIGMAIAVNLLVVSMLQSQIMNEQSVHVPMPSARAAAMGDAYTAEVSDVATVYWNPGTLAFLERTSVILDHYSEAQTQIMSDAVATTLWRTNGSVIALGGTVSHVGYMFSDKSSTMRASQSGISLGYARILAQGFSVGLRASAVYIDIQEKQKWTNSWNVGLAYHPSPEISYGVVYNDALYGAQIQDSSILLKEVLPRRLEIGISLRYPVFRKRHVVALSLANEKIFSESGLFYKGGVEIYPLEFLALRCGYIAGPHVAVARYGGGIRTDIIQLDYAISPSLGNVRFQQLTISLTFK